MQLPEVANLLSSLPQGCQIESGTPLKGIAPNEKLTFTMRRKDDTKGVFNFSVSLMGIPLTDVAAKVEAGDEVKWVKLNA